MAANTHLFCDEQYEDFGIMNAIEWHKENDAIIFSFLDDMTMEEFEGLCRVNDYIFGLAKRYYK